MQNYNPVKNNQFRRVKWSDRTRNKEVMAISYTFFDMTVNSSEVSNQDERTENSPSKERLQFPEKLTYNGEIKLEALYLSY